MGILHRLNGLKKCAIIIQARMSSSRFPGKMMSSLAGMPLVEYVYRRCEKSLVPKVMIATSDDESDDELYSYCKENKLLAIRGSLNNVLERYINAGEFLKADYIVRVCGDTPLVDIFLMDKLVGLLMNNKLDYASLNRETCAAGFYSEAIALKALKKAASLTNEKDDLEHVTKFIIDNESQFLAKFIDTDLNPEFIRSIRLTVDYLEDFERVKSIVERLRDKICFASKDILDILAKERE